MHASETFGAIIVSSFVVQHIVNVFNERVDLIGERRGSSQHAAVFQAPSKVVQTTSYDLQVASIPERQAKENYQMHGCSTKNDGGGQA